MSQSLSKRIVLRNIFLTLFLASTLVLIILTMSNPIIGNVFSQIKSSFGENLATAFPAQSAERVGFTVAIGSLVTSVTSLVGFIVTTVITWRKEKREASLADVQRKKLEVELEKNKFELEELKKGRVKKKVRNKK